MEIYILELIYLDTYFIAHFRLDRDICFLLSFFSRFHDVSDLHFCVAIRSEGPLTLFRVESEAEEIQNRREKCHLSNLHESDDDTDHSNRHGKDSSNLWSGTRLEKSKYPVRRTSPNSHDGKLTKRKSSNDRILVLYLQGNLVLHEISIA